jgi:hypothetical protein
MKRGLAFISYIAWVAPHVLAADQPPIAHAVERGVNYLKSQQDKSSGVWHFVDPKIDGRSGMNQVPESTSGATALAGLTLLECGLPVTDPAIRKARDSVRRASVTLSRTYPISLAILFLDRLGDPSDVPLIESLAKRLLAGQNAQGGWTYEAAQVTPEEVRRLGLSLRAATPGTRPANAPRPNRRPRDEDLPGNDRNQTAPVDPRRNLLPFSDNSNTKFATLALWVARRHGVDVGHALALVETRFRSSQNPDGGWSYFEQRRGRGDMTESTASMTCAGLLGLAVGTAYESVMRTQDAGRSKTREAPMAHRDPAQDSAIQAGLQLLGTVIDRPLVDQGTGLRLFMEHEGDEFYLLWAIERVGVAYGLERIADKDWFGWGSAYLVAHQGKDGSWRGKYAQGGVDTCFALLFLKQANLTKDLTISLTGRVDEPRTSGVPKKVKAADRNEPPAAAPGVPAESSPEPAAPSRPQPAMPDRKENDWQTEAKNLSAQLVKAPFSAQVGLVEEYKEKKGVVYTEALADAIPQLGGDAKAKARDALAQRLARMTPATLQARLADDKTEIRRAAALAAAMKNEKSLIPGLINLLDDRESTVGRAAHAALKSLTKQDFGPLPGATETQRSAAMAQWKAWWQKHDKEPEPPR